MTTQTLQHPSGPRLSVEAPSASVSVFTEDIGSWWPPEHHILQAELAEMVFEPREGGTSTTAASMGAMSLGTRAGL